MWKRIINYLTGARWVMPILREVGAQGPVRGWVLRSSLKGVSIGVFYAVVGRLVEKGLVESEKRPGGNERNYHPDYWYTLTEKGKQALAQEAE